MTSLHQSERKEHGRDESWLLPDIKQLISPHIWSNIDYFSGFVERLVKLDTRVKSKWSINDELKSWNRHSSSV
ncbi:unnamed protein product [Coffea canephora]|uniref:Uncharacterized protein n=1 Tax=Coffea canephora TaxID=49390 RepID=A0A068UG67_COFCA|nr:unnamed protein product [Coffea canephora]